MNEEVRSYMLQKKGLRQLMNVHEGFEKSTNVNTSQNNVPSMQSSTVLPVLNHSESALFEKQ